MILWPPDRSSSSSEVGSTSSPQGDPNPVPTHDRALLWPGSARSSGRSASRAYCLHGKDQGWSDSWIYEWYVPGVELIPGHWPSTNSFSVDLWDMLSREKRERAVLWVMSQIVQADPDLIIGFSQGSVLVLEAASRLGLDLPVILIGSPLHNRFIARILPALYKGRDENAISFWHRGDQIAGAGRSTHVPSKEIQVSSGGHSAPVYLEHPSVRWAVQCA